MGLVVALCSSPRHIKQCSGSLAWVIMNPTQHIWFKECLGGHVPRRLKRRKNEDAQSSQLYPSHRRNDKTDLQNTTISHSGKRETEGMEAVCFRVHVTLGENSSSPSQGRLPNSRDQPRQAQSQCETALEEGRWTGLTGLGVICRIQSRRMRK